VYSQPLTTVEHRRIISVLLLVMSDTAVLLRLSLLLALALATAVTALLLAAAVVGL
jgi:hypothetical protein